MENERFDYNNLEVKNMEGGKKIVRKVSIKNGKGYKSVTHYKKGKKNFSSRKQINKEHISFIKMGKFIPNLFGDCKCGKNKTRKSKK